ELFQQIEHHVRLEAFDRVADRRQLVLDAERLHLVAAAAQRADHVILGLPTVLVGLAVALQRIRRHQLRMHPHQDAKAPHSAIHCRRIGLYSECTVLAVSSTVKSVRNCRSEPTARSFSSRQRSTISSSTVSSVIWYSPVHFDTIRRMV